MRVIQPLRSIHGIRGLQLLRIAIGTNRGMRLFGASVQRRGFGYVVAFNCNYHLELDAAGIYAFERGVPNGGIIY